MWLGSAGLAAYHREKYAVTAASRFTPDSSASANSPIDPVSRYAVAFIPMVRTAAATDRAIGPRRFGSAMPELGQGRTAETPPPGGRPGG